MVVESDYADLFIVVVKIPALINALPPHQLNNLRIFLFLIYSLNWPAKNAYRVAFIVANSKKVPPSNVN